MATNDRDRPVLEIRATFRVEPSYLPGSLEIYETLLLPPGSDALGVARAVDEALQRLASRLVADRLSNNPARR